MRGCCLISLCAGPLPRPTHPALPAPSPQAETQPGMFCGLPLDEDTQDHLTDGRIAAWTAQVLAEMGLAAHV